MEKVNWIKGIIATIGAFLSAKLGILYIILPFLMLCMLIDYGTGVLASKKEGKISSKVGMWGIIKKLTYGIEVVVALILDWTILNVAGSIGVSVPVNTIFGLLISIWLILNELISILENLIRLDTPMPPFLINTIKGFKVSVENKGDDLSRELENKDKQE